MAVTKEILTLAVETGDALLRNGAEVYRVEDTVLHILKAYEITDCDVYVLSNGIFASANENREDACSMIRHVPLGSTHLGRIAALNQLSREICSHECSLRDAWVRLEECKSIPKNKNWVEIFFCGVGSAGFCYLFGGSFFDSATALLAGCILYIFLLYVLPKLSLPKIMYNIAASIIAVCSCILLYSVGLGDQLDRMTIGALFPLVPGIALTNSFRNFLENDYLAGLVRLVDALVTAGGIAIGVGIATALFL